MPRIWVIFGLMYKSNKILWPKYFNISYCRMYTKFFLMMILSIKVEHNMRRRITNRFIRVTKIWLRYVTVYQWFKNKGLSVFWLMLWLLLVVWDVVVVIFDLFLVKCMFLCCSYRRGSTTFGNLEIEEKCMQRHKIWQRWIDA